MKQHAKRASWARVLLVPTLLLGSASMAAFPVPAAQVELNQTVTLQMRKVKLADGFKKLKMCIRDRIYGGRRPLLRLVI